MIVQLNERQKMSLECMAGQLRISQAEVLRRAFSLFKVVVREARAGNQLAVVKDGKVVKEIVGINLC